MLFNTPSPNVVNSRQKVLAQRMIAKMKGGSRSNFTMQGGLGAGGSMGAPGALKGAGGAGSPFRGMSSVRSSMSPGHTQLGSGIPDAILRAMGIGGRGFAGKDFESFPGQGLGQGQGAGQGQGFGVGQGPGVGQSNPDYGQTSTPDYGQADPTQADPMADPTQDDPTSYSSSSAPMDYSQPVGSPASYSDPSVPNFSYDPTTDPAMAQFYPPPAPMQTASYSDPSVPNFSYDPTTDPAMAQFYQPQSDPSPAYSDPSPAYSDPTPTYQPAAPDPGMGGLIPLGGGRYYDPATDTIRGGR